MLALCCKRLLRMLLLLILMPCMCSFGAGFVSPLQPTILADCCCMLLLLLLLLLLQQTHTSHRNWL
jgi:hypothetical protein